MNCIATILAGLPSLGLQGLADNLHILAHFYDQSVAIGLPALMINHKLVDD
ncbi:hypothetical protein VRK_08150 [Vibrio sp. MEBiC08052]|nr:hypothetical protein VRK_08150 [Vibrio sp. MEBiC08052]